MKQTMQKIAIALCMALAFAACKNDDPETGGGVESITIEPKQVTLKAGEEKNLTAKINGDVSTEVTWSSGEPDIVAVDDNGKVTAKKEGTAKITATAKADTTKTATCTVTVTKANITVTLDQSELTLGIGKDATLQAKINGVNSTEVTWKSSDETVATVVNGKVTAKKEGTATITVTLTADKAKTATCSVTVVDKTEVLPSGVTLNKNGLSLEVGDTETLTATITNASAVKEEHKKITWTSSDASVAAVDNNGKVTAVSVGEAKITAKTTNGIEATCTVTVTEAITVTLDSAELSLKVDEEKTLVATITGTDTKAVTWKSSDESVATVDNNGKVAAKKKGTATVTVTLTADTTKTATCSVTVVDKDEVMPDGVTLNKNGLSLEVGGTETLTATITNASAVKEEFKKITWTSSKESVATVNDDGLVTAVSAGEAKITAKTTNGIDATCTVTVTEAITVTLDSAELSLKVDEEKTLVATIAGTDSTAVTWKSSDESVATVDDNGKVTAKKEGTAKITATAKADATKTATCSVTVVDKTEVLPSGVTLDKNNLSLEVGGTETLMATIANASAVREEYKTITWTSSNTSVATVDNNGKVTAVRAGTATITATTQNERKAECIVTVTTPATTPVAASDDAWDFTKKADEVPYKDFDSAKAGSIDSDISISGKNNNLTLVLSAAGTGVGNTTATPKYKYQANNGLCIKSAALKIDGIKGSVTATIEWYLSGSDDRNLEVTVNGKTIATPSGTATGGKTPYTVNFDAGDGTTLYIGASNELYIKSITVTPQSGGGTVTPNPDPDPTPDPDPSDKTISLTDAPLGYASLGKSYATTGGTTVTNRTGLLSAIKNGGVIIIDGMIDMSDGMLPSTPGGSNAKLDTFVKEQTAVLHNSDSSKYPQTFDTYKAFVDAYANLCSKSTNDKSNSSTATKLSQTLWGLNSAYGNTVTLNIKKSNITLVGKGLDAGIKGGSINISGASNVQIRNLTIQDAYDPFPHHEEDDGFNAERDCIVVQGASKNIWIDHCTLKDTIWTGTAANGEKWQTYDGLCDIKGNSENITISNCKFQDHDKTMLIGSSDSESVSVTRTVTLYRNYFYNCGQRLPMVRKTNVHVLNNYYDASSPHYDQQYAIGVRANANVYSENNYFGDGIKYSVSGATGSAVKGSLYSTGDSDESKSKKRTDQFNTSNTSQFTPDYNLDKLKASAVPESVKSSAGAGYRLK